MSIWFTLLLESIKQTKANIKIYLRACAAGGNTGDTLMMIEIGVRPLNQKSGGSFNITIKSD
jgi:hypothetical protein